MALPDNRLRFQGPRFDFSLQVGLTGQDHDNYPAAGMQPRYDQLRMYLISLLANQSSFDQPVEYREGSLWFNLNTNALQISCNDIWESLSNAITLDTNITLQQWYTAVKVSLTGSADSPDPFVNGVFTTGHYADPPWITSLNGSKIIGGIDANLITGVMAKERFPQLQIGTYVGSSIPQSVLFISSTNEITEDADIFTYNSENQSLVMNNSSGMPAIVVNETVPGSKAHIYFQHVDAGSDNYPRGVLDIGTIDKLDPILGGIPGDSFILATGNLLLGTDGNTALLGLGTDKSVNIYSTTGLDSNGVPQGLLNLYQANLAAANAIRFNIYGGYAYIGINNQQPYLLVNDATHVNELIIRNDDNIRFSINGGVSTAAVLSNAGIYLNLPTFCPTLTIDTDLNMGGTITANSINLNGATSLPGSSISCVNVIATALSGTLAPADVTSSMGLANLTADLNYKANDNEVVHIGGDEKIVGSKSFWPPNGVETPIVVVGTYGQTANLQEWRVSTSADNSTISAPLAHVSWNGIFTGDGSGLTNLNISDISATSGILLVASGGTGATGNTYPILANTARSNLGLAIGSAGVPGDVQQYDLNLSTLASLIPAGSWSAANTGSMIIGTATSWALFAPGSSTNGSFLVLDTTKNAGVRWSAVFSNPGYLNSDGTGGTSERFGAHTQALGAYSVAFGNNADAATGSDYSVAIGGQLSLSSPQCVVIGYEPTVLAGNTIAIGGGINTGGSDVVAVGYQATGMNQYDITIGSAATIATNTVGAPGIAIGHGAVGDGNSVVLGAGAGSVGIFPRCVLLGNSAQATAAGQLVVGSTSAPITDFYLGAGVAGIPAGNTIPPNVTIHGTGGVGSNNKGSNVILMGGAGTGSAIGGDIVFQSLQAGTSGTSANTTMVEYGRFTYNQFSTGNCSFQSTYTGSIGLLLKGANGQTADLVQYQNYNNQVLFRVAKDGVAALSNLATSTAPTLSVSSLSSASAVALTSTSANPLLSLASTTVTSAGASTTGISNVVSGVSAAAFGIYSNISNSASMYGICSDINGTGALPPTSLMSLVGRLAIATGTADAYGLYVDNENQGSGNTYGAMLIAQGSGSAKTHCGLSVRATQINTGYNCGIVATAANGVTNIAGQFNGRVVLQNLATYGGGDGTEFLELTDSTGNIYASISHNGMPGYNLHMGGVCEGRLSLSSTDPYPGDYIPGPNGPGNMLYYIPYMGDRITLYRPGGSPYILETVPIPPVANPLSLSLAGLANATNYDIFVQNSTNNQLALVAVAWTYNANPTLATRAITLVRTNEGLLVQAQMTGTNIGQPDPAHIHQRYIGTIRTNDLVATCEDSPVRRFVWNHYNRLLRKLVYMITTTSWSYNSSLWRPMDLPDTAGYPSTPAIQHIQLVVGWPDILIDASCFVSAIVPSNSGMESGFGIDQPPATVAGNWVAAADVYGWIGAVGGSVNGAATAHWVNYLTPGYHYLTGMERATGTVTCNGNGQFSGILAFFPG